MGSVNLVVIVESARDLITHGGGDTNKFHVPSIVAVGAALGMSLPAFDKRILLLYVLAGFELTKYSGLASISQVSSSFYFSIAILYGHGPAKY